MGVRPYWRIYGTYENIPYLICEKIKAIGHKLLYHLLEVTHYHYLYLQGILGASVTDHDLYQIATEN